MDTWIVQLVAYAGREAVRADSAEATLQACLNRVTELEKNAESSGFGVHVERVLTAAEHEAAEVRTRAAAESAALLEEARTQAELHRHQAEQSLLTRVSALDQEAAVRNAALGRRQREIVESREEARQEAEGIRADAQHAAAAARSAAEEQIRQLVAEAEQAVRQEREAATREIARLNSVQEHFSEELARLHSLLGGKIGELGPADGRIFDMDPAKAEIRRSAE